jgi:hypothetical protein
MSEQYKQQPQQQQRELNVSRVLVLNNPPAKLSSSQCFFQGPLIHLRWQGLSDHAFGCHRTSTSGSYASHSAASACPKPHGRKLNWKAKFDRRQMRSSFKR